MGRRLFYVVQPVVEVGSALAAGEARAYGCATDAEAAGAALSRRAPGVVVYMVEGDPEHECWDEPELLALYGRMPDHAA